MSSYRLREKIGIVTATVAGAVLLLLRFGEFPVAAGMDDAYYIEMARSLAEGQGPVIHLNRIVPAWRPGLFPLGFPLLLSPLAYLAPASVQIFKLATIAAWIALVPVCFRLAQSWNKKDRLALAALVLLNPWTIAYAVRVFSDLPFAVVSLAAVILFIGQADLPRIHALRFLALVIVTGAAIMIRTVGLALPVAMILYWILHRRWSRVLLLGGTVAFILLPHAFLSGQPEGGFISQPYLQQVFSTQEPGLSRVQVLLENLSGYLRELPAALLPLFGSPLESLAGQSGLAAFYGPMQIFVGLLLITGVLHGLLVSGRRLPGRSRFIFLYLVIYAGVLLNFSGYPTGVQVRLLLPILPLLYLMLLESLQGWAGSGRIFWSAVALVLCLSLVHNGYRAVRTSSQARTVDEQAVLNPRLGTAWITAHTHPDEVVMVRWPLRQHIHFRRPVVGYGTLSRNGLEQRIKTFEVDYIWLGPDPDPRATSDLLGLIQSHPDRFEEVHRDSVQDIVIFKVGKRP